MPPPPPAVEHWVKAMLGFGVTVAVSLAALYGSKSIPLFSSLLNLIPDDLHGFLVPVTSALMGLAAVVVQWYSEDKKLDRAVRRKAFWWSVAIAASGAVALFLFSFKVVKTVPFGSNDRSSSTFLIGFVRPNKSPCTPKMTDVQCIGFVSLDQDKITQYWGELNVNFAALSLCFTYLTFMLGFASAVAIAMYRQGDKNAEANRKPATSSAGSDDDGVHLPELNSHSTTDDQRPDDSGA